jgi:hypothetical protein
LDVEFSQDEIGATRDYFARTDRGQDEDKLPPGETPVVTLRYNPDEARVEASTAAEFFQFHGRRYARMIYRYAQEGARLFERVGEVFWYTEHRTTNSLTPVESNGQIVTFDDVNLLRRRMADWFYFHERVERGEFKLRWGGC